MGTPIKVDVNGRPVFICCEGCRESLLAEPAKYLAKLSKEVDQMITKILDFCIRERLVDPDRCPSRLWPTAGTPRKNVPLDAIPNVGENQVIVLTEWMGRSPKDMEDQITYPLSVALQAVPGAEERARQEHVRLQLRAGHVRRRRRFLLGPFARGRTTDDRLRHRCPRASRRRSAPMRRPWARSTTTCSSRRRAWTWPSCGRKQDFFVKYALQSVDGVAEVASIGGYVRQYQIEVDPDKLRYHNIPLSQVIDAVKASNIDVGAKTVESGGMEFIVRGKGFIGSGKTEPETLEQIENTVVLTRDGVPVRVRDVAQVQIGPAFRRGALDFNGRKRSAAWS